MYHSTLGLRVIKKKKKVDSGLGDASERSGNTLKHNFSLKAKARIWPWLSYMCHIRSGLGVALG